MIPLSHRVSRFSAIAAPAAAPAAGCRQAGGQLESGPHGAVHEIHRNGLGLLIESFVDQEGKAAVLNYFIGFFWLIQSHSQAGSPSTSGHYDPDGLNVLALEEFLDHLIRFLCNFQHIYLLLKVNICRGCLPSTRAAKVIMSAGFVNLFLPGKTLSPSWWEAGKKWSSESGDSWEITYQKVSPVKTTIFMPPNETILTSPLSP
jgi:hypothetical protein